MKYKNENFLIHWLENGFYNLLYYPPHVLSMYVSTESQLYKSSKGETLMVFCVDKLMREL